MDKCVSGFERHSLIAKPEPATVQVELLSGQRLEVGCRSDSTAGEVFDAVVSHEGLAEHALHGLAVPADGEFFFLEPGAKLAKTAPPVPHPLHAPLSAEANE